MTERDIKTETQLEDFMIAILFLILVQMQVTVVNHNERRTVRRRVELSGGGWNGP